MEAVARLSWWVLVRREGAMPLILTAPMKLGRVVPVLVVTKGKDGYVEIHVPGGRWMVRGSRDFVTAFAEAVAWVVNARATFTSPEKRDAES